MSIELVMPSNYLILYCPLLLLPSIFPSIRVFSNESALRTRWPKFQLQHQYFHEYSGLISFRIDWLDLLTVNETLKSSPASQFKGISSLVLSLLCYLALMSIDDYWKNDSFDNTGLCRQSDVSAFQYTAGLSFLFF